MINRVLHPNSLFALQYVHDARYSPDGARIVYLTSRTDEAADKEFFDLTIVDRRSGDACRVQFIGRAAYPRWSPDGKRLAFIGAAAETQHLYVCSADGAGVRALTPDGVDIEGPVDWTPDGSTLACTVFTRPARECAQRVTATLHKFDGIGSTQGLVAGVCLVDAERGGIEVLDVGPSIAMHPVFSPCGKRLLFSATPADAGFPSLTFARVELHVLDLQTRAVTRVLGEDWFIAAYSWSPCGERIVVAGDYASKMPLPMPHLWVVNWDGSGIACRTAGQRVCIGSRVHHDMPTWVTSHGGYFIVPDRRTAYATVLFGGATEIWKIDLDGPVRGEPVVTGPRTCVLLDVEEKSSRLLFSATNLRTPFELNEIDLANGMERQLTHLNDEVLASWPEMKVEHLTFESDDGVSLEGWFLARADRRGPQPTVMFIHGGPMLATGHAFRYDFHLLAANGIAVVFANFRGSSGYGKAFNRALAGDWGGRGFPDHMAAVDAVLERGLADPERLGVWGPSHGGFATGWIVGHTNRFKAAVAESAALNFSTMYYLSDAADLFLYDLGGRPNEIPDVYRSRSPLTYAHRCRTPTLLLHGEDDLRCPISEAEQFYRVLRDVGCTTELVRIAGMTHVGDSMGPLAVRVAQNEALLDWFERHL